MPKDQAKLTEAELRSSDYFKWCEDHGQKPSRKDFLETDPFHKHFLGDAFTIARRGQL